MDANCPYCDEPQEINHDDGYGYREDIEHEQECGGCGKVFVFTTAVMYHYDAYCKGDHDLEPVENHPGYVECSRKNCEYFERARQSPITDAPREDEMTEEELDDFFARTKPADITNEQFSYNDDFQIEGAYITDDELQDDEEVQERLECFTLMDTGALLDRMSVFELLTRVADNCNDPVKSQKLLELAEASNQPLGTSNQPLGKGIEL